MIAVLVDGATHEQERELIDGIICVGNIPLIVTTQDPAAAGVTDWVYADHALSLPDGAPLLSRVEGLRKSDSHAGPGHRSSGERAGAQTAT